MKAFTRILYVCLVIVCCSLIPRVVSQEELQPEDLIYDAGELGVLQGAPWATYTGQRPMVELKGIPYVEPTLENSRFLPPLPVQVPLAPEGTIFDATRPGPCCPQMPVNLLCSFRMSEDCLRMNIYTPQLQSNITTLFPVIVFIHGGAFTLGSADIYNGNRLLDRDVVVVNFNYRLGLLGFFCLNDEEAPGNAAMYDMVEALKFIKKYIHHFGGDPERITITGQSAGSVAVTQLLLSPLTRDQGLFHRAIAMSGTALNEWGTTSSANAEAASLEVARLLGCYNPGVPYVKNDVINCMRAIPSSELVQKLEDYQLIENSEGRLGFGPVTPVVQVVGTPPFLDKEPEAILEANEEADVPLMMGATRHDGSFVLATVYNKYMLVNGVEEDETFLKSRLVPTLLQALGIQDKTGAIYDLLATTYLGKEAKESGNFTIMTPGLTDLHSVFFFKAAAFRTLQLHSRLHNQSYWYNFDHHGEHSVYPTIAAPSPVRGGVGHGDDLIYIFTIPFGPDVLNDEDLAVSERLVDYWVNFAYTGNPNIGEENGERSYMDNTEGWPAYSEDLPQFARIHGAADEFLTGPPGEQWLGVSEELWPELQDPVPTTTTPPAEPTTTTSDGSESSTSDGPESTPGGSLMTAASLIVLSITSLFIALNN